MALYGEKWHIAGEILNRFESSDVNITNSLGDITPLLLAAKHGWCTYSDLFNVFIRILERTNQENINKPDGNGWTALHYDINNKSVTKIEELLKNKDVNVNVKNNNNQTALHLASEWKYFPMDLFKIILEKSTDVINAQDEDGNTALQIAIINHSNVIKALLAHKDVNVNVKNNKNETALTLASYEWKDTPSDLFKLIQEKSTNIDLQAIILAWSRPRWTDYSPLCNFRRN